MKYFSSLLLLFTLHAPCRAQQYKLGLNLAKGSTYYLASNGISTIMQSVNGRQNKVNLVLAFKIAFKVIGVMDTVYNMEVSYQSLDMKINMADTTIEMDSKKNSVLDVPSSIVAAIMNKPFNITLSKTGKIRSVENFEKMINGVFDGFTKIDSNKKQQIKRQFMQSFGVSSFKDILEMGTAIFPQKAVAKNDTWIINSSVDAPAKANLQVIYQLIDATGNLYQVHGDGTMVSDKGAPPAEVNGMPMKYNLNGSMLTDVMINKNTGWISEVNLKQLMSGNILIPDNPRVPGGMTIPMTFNTEVTTTSPTPPTR